MSDQRPASCRYHPWHPEAEAPPTDVEALAHELAANLGQWYVLVDWDGLFGERDVIRAIEPYLPEGDAERLEVVGYPLRVRLLAAPASSRLPPVGPTGAPRHG